MTLPLLWLQQQIWKVQAGVERSGEGAQIGTDHVARCWAGLAFALPDLGPDIAARKDRVSSPVMLCCHAALVWFSLSEPGR